jgi:hypothetical protein
MWLVDRILPNHVSFAESRIAPTCIPHSEVGGLHPVLTATMAAKNYAFDSVVDDDAVWEFGAGDYGTLRSSYGR